MGKQTMTRLSFAGMSNANFNLLLLRTFLMLFYYHSLYSVFLTLDNLCFWSCYPFYFCFIPWFHLVFLKMLFDLRLNFFNEFLSLRVMIFDFSKFFLLGFLVFLYCHFTTVFYLNFWFCLFEVVHHLELTRLIWPLKSLYFS